MSTSTLHCLQNADNLLNPAKLDVVQEQETIEEELKQEEVPKFKRPSLREIFQMESERNNEDNK